MAGRWMMLPALAIGVLAARPAAATDVQPQILALACAGRADPAGGRDLAFTATIPFEGGQFVALASPETNAVARLLYGSEVLVGSIELGAEPGREIVWTRATSRKGGLVGFFVDETGGVTSLAVHAAPQGSTERPFYLFATGAGALYRGSCH